MTPASVHTDLLMIGHQHQLDVFGLRQDVPPPLQGQETDSGQRSEVVTEDGEEDREQTDPDLNLNVSAVVGCLLVQCTMGLVVDLSLTLCVCVALWMGGTAVWETPQPPAPPPSRGLVENSR